MTTPLAFFLAFFVPSLGLLAIVLLGRTLAHVRREAYAAQATRLRIAREYHPASRTNAAELRRIRQRQGRL